MLRVMEPAFSFRSLTIFSASECQAQGKALPEPGHYGVAMLFVPKNEELQAKCDEILSEAIGHYGLSVIAWRDVPTHPDCLGEIALSAEPGTKQLFIDGNGLAGGELEHRLYMARKARRTHRQGSLR
jgi:glutamate synthase (NADPH/NADH) large chain